MNNGPVTDIIRQVRFLSPEDGLDKVVGVMRASQTHALPVTRNGHVIGLVTEGDVLSRLPEDSANATVADVMRYSPPCAGTFMSISQAADVMKITGADVLPVVDELGSYRGVVVRSDIVAALVGMLRPPMVAGMATPLGVHLTTGAVSAGAGSLGLFLSGVALMLMMEASRALVWLAVLVGDKLVGTHLATLLLSPPVQMMSKADALRLMLIPLQLVLMLAFLRFSTISGYHAAEHQVVHAIEAGEPLKPEIVARLPRAHPRCGTNLMAAATIFTVLVSQLGSGAGVVVAMLVVVVGWRTVGYYLQQYVTTKRPAQKHVLNGIKVGEQLLDRYREQPNIKVDGFTRIWNMGIPQVAFGFATVLVLDELLMWLLHIDPWF
ncbi:MAG: DUF1385 domain-containing protein [Armatimonadetes bacterium]|nr:DUF1385 domain-containing protein [Armatimonadota bacterium]